MEDALLVKNQTVRNVEGAELKGEFQETGALIFAVLSEVSNPTRVLP